MGTGQTILTIVAIVLLGTNVVSVNRTFTQHGTILQQTEIGLFGVSLATSLLEEARGKAFDHYSLIGFPTVLTQLTPPDSLGPEPSELRINWDDFDDYNNLRDTVNVPDVDKFYRWASVAYVDTTNPNITRNYRTWLKKLTVYVRGQNSADTLQMSYLFSNWSFR
jgi:hypothetical protein